MEAASDRKWIAFYASPPPSGSMPAARARISSAALSPVFGASPTAAAALAAARERCALSAGWTRRSESRLCHRAPRHERNPTTHNADALFGVADKAEPHRRLRATARWNRCEPAVRLHRKNSVRVGCDPPPNGSAPPRFPKLPAACGPESEE